MRAISFTSPSKYFILFIICFLSFEFSNSEDVDTLIQAKCDGQTIKYTILANLSEYLENENNIDEREFYTKESLKNIKLGIIKDTYFNSDGYQNITEYENIDDIIAAIRSHEIEGMLLDIATANDSNVYK